MEGALRFLNAKVDRLEKFDTPNEGFRILLDELLRDFIKQNAVDIMEFPPSFTKEMRSVVHTQCVKFNLKKKSTGSNDKRRMTISKKQCESSAEVFECDLSPDTVNILSHVKDIATTRTHETDFEKKPKVQLDCIGKLFQGSMVNISKPITSPLHAFRKSLPIYCKQNDIMETIEKHQVVLINAETGSGKTTQIPQYILEKAALTGNPIRIICTQPRRLSTIAVAERVAEERGEEIGQTVGYQIKLDFKLGINTGLIYCTNGVLLRTLMSGDECFKQVSHIIVDEIHERDKFTDFLLICLRESIKNHPHLRVVLMSATMDMDLYMKYFESVQVLHVQGRSHQCHQHFLEDVLTMVNYENKEMRELRQLRERNGGGGSSTRNNAVLPTRAQNQQKYAELDECFNDEVTEALAKCFSDQFEIDDLYNLMQLILNENVNPNFQDFEGRTPLMAAAYQGNIHTIEQLLHMGADLYLTSNDGLTATGWAQRNAKLFANQQNFDAVNMLNFYQQGSLEDSLNCNNDNAGSIVLSDYNRSMGDDAERIDFDLIVEIVRYIHCTMKKEGAILVFLPGYEDILACSDKIYQSDLKRDQLKVFMLHGSMQMRSQQEVFRKFNSVRKIILATNIAETSITIDDVRFVIDSGKAKIKSYDSISGASSLKSEWISMANSKQRAGRAGRTAEGYCFHLYSLARYESFYMNPIPEILRVPLHELCLQTKMLAPANMPIKEFLNLSIEPPSSMAVENSINTLLKLGALDQNECLTPLGHHLVQLSLEPHLGKMLLYASIFRCIDPVLTIVSSMTHKDAFILPTQAHLKKEATERRKGLSEGSLSDHVSLIRAFQYWQDHKVNRKEVRFCSENFISHATMELIMVTRTQLLSQLRAMGFVQTNHSDTMHKLNVNSNCWPVVKGCIAAGLYPNVAYRTFSARLHTRFEPRVNIFSSSCVFGSEFHKITDTSSMRDAWLIYDEITKNGYVATIKSATVVNPLTIALLCGQNCLIDEYSNVIIDDCFDLRFNDNPNVGRLRNNIFALIDKKINHPYRPLSYDEIEAVKVLTDVLTLEDAFHSLITPFNIGKRPLITHYAPHVQGDRYVNHSASNHSNGGGTRSNNRQHQPQQQQQQQNYYDGYYGGHENSQQHQHQYQQHRNNGSMDYQRDFQQRDFQRAGPSRFTQQRSNDQRSFAQRHNEEQFTMNALYFIIKPPETKNIAVGIERRCWNFSPQTEKKLFKYFQEGYTVFLIFNAKNQPQELYGVARLLSTNNGIPNNPCALKWISSNSISVRDVKNFIHCRIHLVEDGQQLDSDVGQKLCSFICENGDYRVGAKRNRNNNFRSYFNNK